MRISDWSSDVCSSDLQLLAMGTQQRNAVRSHHGLYVRCARSTGEGRAQEGRFSGFHERCGGCRGLRAVRGCHVHRQGVRIAARSEEHTSELQSLMRISYAVFCLKKKKYQ